MQSKDEALAELAKDCDAVVTRAALHGLGFTDREIQTQLDRKRWQQLQRGVYLLAAGSPTWRHRALAALLRLDGAVEGFAELTVAYGKGPAPRGAIVHRTTYPSRTRMVNDSLPGTSIERLLVDYAAVVSTALAERAVESALVKGLTAERRIWQEVARLGPGVRGVRRLERLMENRPNGKPARSNLELQVLRVIRDGGLPLPERNHDSFVDGQRYEVDLAYVDARGAIEADSRHFHSTATQRRNDARRQATLEMAGWRFTRITWADALGRPEWVVEQVRNLICGVVAA
jgi:hypothetical protein